MNIRTLFVALTGAVALIVTASAQTPSASDLYQEALRYQESKGDVVKAIEIYKSLISQYPKDAVAPRALLELASCYEKTGQPDAGPTYERIVREYGSSPSAMVARAKLSAPVQKDGFAAAKQVWDDTAGRVTPDGKYLLLTDWDTGDLTLREISSGRQRHVTANPKGSSDFAQDLVPSPDGKSILYNWWDEKAELYDVRLIGRDGGQPRAIFPNRDKNSYAAPIGWTADGTQALVWFRHVDPVNAASVAQTDVLMVPLRGGAPRLIKTFAGNAGAAGTAPGNFRASPTTDYVVFDRALAVGKPERDLFILSLADGSVSPVAPHSATETVLDWYPSGDRLLFLSDRTGTPGMWSIAVVNGRAQGEPVLVRADTGGAGGVGFTNKGDYYYRQISRDLGVAMATLDPSAGKVVGQLERLEGRYQSGQMQAAWSTDGTQIAYVQLTKLGAAMQTGRGGNAQSDQRLAIQTIATGEVRLLQLPMINMVNPVWMPGDKTIVVHGNAQAGQGIYLVDVATGAITAFAVRPPERAGAELNREQPQVSADGRTVFFRRFGSAQQTPVSSLTVMARDLDSTTERTIVAGDVGAFALSPDSKWLAVRPRESSDGHLTIYPASGGEPRRIAENSSQFRADIFAWSHDSRSVLIAKRAESGFDVWRFPIDGSAPQAIGIRLPGSSIIGRISLSPDGRRLAISSEATAPSTWVMQKK
jgi:Tol biopolymer transport system component